MVVYATRYCLGRQTYAVDECASYLIDNWSSIYEKDQWTILKDIERALANDEAGRGMDRRRWEAVLAAAKAEVKMPPKPKVYPEGEGPMDGPMIKHFTPLEEA